MMTTAARAGVRVRQSTAPSSQHDAQRDRGIQPGSARPASLVHRGFGRPPPAGMAPARRHSKAPGQQFAAFGGASPRIAQRARQAAINFSIAKLIQGDPQRHGPKTALSMTDQAGSAYVSPWAHGHRLYIRSPSPGAGWLPRWRWRRCQRRRRARHESLQDDRGAGPVMIADGRNYLSGDLEWPGNHFEEIASTFEREKERRPQPIWTPQLGKWRPS